MEERIALMRAYESGAFTVAELAASYGVSREIGKDHFLNADGTKSVVKA